MASAPIEPRRSVTEPGFAVLAHQLLNIASAAAGGLETLRVADAHRLSDVGERMLQLSERRLADLIARLHVLVRGLPEQGPAWVEPVERAAGAS